MHRTLWVLQIVLGVYFVFVGVMHFALPDGLPSAMDWMYELSDGLHVVSGTAEILGGLGLLLPGITGIRPDLTALAAVGLVIVMFGAAIWHLDRGEPANVVQNIVIAAILGVIAYGRWRISPLPGSYGTPAA